MTNSDNNVSGYIKIVSISIILFLTSLTHAADLADRSAAFQLESKDKVIHSQEIYKTIDTLNLKIDVFYTSQSIGKRNKTAIVFFHGGGWAYGTPGEFFTTCERYAKMGIVTFSVDYRLSIENGVTPNKMISPIECIMDAKSAMRWVRGNADKFNIDQNKIIASGQSAGGHLALCTAMIDEYNEKSDDLSISCRPNALLLFSACVNAVEGWCDRLLGDRRDKIWSISPFHHVKTGLPPMIEFHGIDDDQVPKWTVQFFEMEMEKEGNYFEQHMYEGRKHYLGEGNPKYSRYYDDDILNLTDDFLRKFNLLD
jgi:acetyl esterase